MVAATAPLEATSLALFLKQNFASLTKSSSYTVFIRRITHQAPIFPYDNSIKQFIYHWHQINNFIAFCGENKDFD